MDVSRRLVVMFSPIASEYIRLMMELGLVIALLVLAALLRRKLWQYYVNRKSKAVDGCECGYPLKDLSVPRCPECGRVVGCQATAEELGLTVEQLERVQAARQRRKRDGIP